MKPTAAAWTFSQPPPAAPVLLAALPEPEATADADPRRRG